MKLTDLLDQIDRLDQEATKGPWYAESKNEDDYYALTAVYNVFHNGDTPDRDLMAYGAYDNAEFIALARTALPQFAKALRAVMELHKTRVHDEDPTSPFCNICGPGTPCETTRAITDALGGDDA